MPKTQLSCPNCSQPIVADVEQLFDVGQDPRAKQALISGVFNMAQCPHCGYQGNLAAPIVYHDPEKELLLTFVPPELMLSRDEQERIIGPLITRAVDSLPQEQRKGYLFSPQTMMTHKLLVETILEADGITKEMIETQEKKMALIQKLLEAEEDARPAMIKEEDELIDEEFFVLFSRLAEVALSGGDQNAAVGLRDLQDALLEHSSTGVKVKAESDEIQAARETLQELGEELTREKLLELVIDAPNQTRLRAYTQMTRPGMDYQFFQQLSEIIEGEEGDEKNRLLELRESLLQMTGEIDQVVEQRMQVARQNLDTLLQVEDIEATIKANLAAVDEIFIQVLTEALTAARETGDIERSGKLQQVMSTIEAATAAPPEFELIDELLAISDDDQALTSMLNSQADEVNAKLIEIMSGLMGQIQASADAAQGEAQAQQQEMLEALQKVYNVALRLSMERSFKA
ncbi:MAG: CpXC domain-containing protein [Anaerolineales bacterium]|nr:CpXC domain-containing protein [Chloroflexota bacterium]MBL6982293.1 CpXC domain-containing protein [Anaerolineales bacterium]